MGGMSTAKVLEREEYIEQAYFFRVLRERATENLATQDILVSIHEEILSTTRLPYAIQFLAAEIKHSGLLSTGFSRLPHYFTAFQSYVIRGTEEEKLRFSLDTALLAMQREAEYRAARISAAGLFVYQFEVIARNRLGYDDGLISMTADPFYDRDWSAFVDDARTQIGLIDLADLIYLRSELAVSDQRRSVPDFQPTRPPLFGEKEGKIARANRGRDPLYLFAALQRQLGYPEVPRPVPPDSLASKFETLKARVRDLEARLKVLESEVRGQLDLKQLEQLGKPDLLKDDD
jgi:hypothetical protein